MSRTCDFACVYVEEAHAENEWPISRLPPSLSFAQHTTLAERAHAAAEFRAAFELHPDLQLCVDSFGDGREHPAPSARARSPLGSFNATFASWSVKCLAPPPPCTLSICVSRTVRVVVVVVVIVVVVVSVCAQCSQTVSVARALLVCGQRALAFLRTLSPVMRCWVATTARAPRRQGASRAPTKAGTRHRLDTLWGVALRRPFRWWVFQDGVVVQKPMPKDCTYCLPDLQRWLWDHGHGAQRN